MRRFIASLPGKIISHIAAGSLLLPFATLFVVSRASAQFAQLPTWAVVDFVNKAPQGGDTFGKTAAEAVTSELTKTQLYDVTPIETVHRVADSIGLQMPVTGQVNLMRLGQELHASSILTGEIANYRIVSNNGTKHADVIMRVVVIDVSSGLAVNGAALVAHSTDRAGSVADETLINEAIASGANIAITQIQSKTLPTGTLLNTLTNTGLINQGARSGFQEGQSVIVVRGRDQVATATVYDVEPDQAYIRVVRQTRGMQPGDRVRVVFSVPEIDNKWPKNSQGDVPVYAKSKTRPSSSGFVQLLLLAGLMTVFFGQGRAGNTNVFTNVIPEAGLFNGIVPSPDPATGTPGIRVSWGTDLFFRSNSQKVQYQLYRLQSGGPQVVNVIIGSQSTGIDSTIPVNITNYADFGGVIGGSTCQNPTLPSGTPTTEPAGVVLGQAYQYAVELVYKLSALDLPHPTGTGDCYFVTSQALTNGFATALASPTLVFPQDQTTITGPLSFSFNSAQTSSNPITVDYIVELSTTTTFSAGTTVAVLPFTRNTSGTVQTPSQINILDTHSTVLPSYITSPNTTTIYWRAGVRNNIDRPGPVPDAIGQRYIFSTFRTLVKPLTPPGPVTPP